MKSETGLLLLCMLGRAGRGNMCGPSCLDVFSSQAVERSRPHVRLMTCPLFNNVLGFVRGLSHKGSQRGQAVTDHFLHGPPAPDHTCGVFPSCRLDCSRDAIFTDVFTDVSELPMTKVSWKVPSVSFAVFSHSLCFAHSSSPTRTRTRKASTFVSETRISGRCTRLWHVLLQPSDFLLLSVAGLDQRLCLKMEDVTAPARVKPKRLNDHEPCLLLVGRWDTG